MTGIDPEGAVDAVVLTLQTHLGPTIDTLNAEPGAVQLAPVPLDRWFPGGHGGPIPDLGVIPAGEVSAATGRAEDFDIHHYSGDHTLTIMVALWFGEPEYQELARRCWRYVRALSTVLARDGVAGPHTTAQSVEWDVGLALDPNADGGNAPQSWRGCAFMVLTVRDRVRVQG